jgi:putative SOS response-associated peptidase YedK
MCGRYVSVSSPSLLAAHFGVEEVRTDDAEANYNVAPRAEVPIVAVSRDVRVLDRVRWGLVPFWAKDASIGDKLINARAETVAEKPAYRRAFERKRCIIPADGFYEWRAVDQERSGAPPAEGLMGGSGSDPKSRNRKKQPYFIRRTDGEPLAFAGLWDAWYDPTLENPRSERSGAPPAEGRSRGSESDPKRRLRSCAIVTTVANHELTPLHHRMPVVLPEEAWAEWLDPAQHDVARLQQLCVPLPDGELRFHPVSTLVNKADNNGPELLDEVALI